jgi:hypothetical protein
MIEAMCGTHGALAIFADVGKGASLSNVLSRKSDAAEIPVCRQKL